MPEIFKKFKEEGRMRKKNLIALAKKKNIRKGKTPKANVQAGIKTLVKIV